MRKPRFSYPGAIHLIKNSGRDEKEIFFDGPSKYYFIEIINENSNTQKINIYAYCILPNGYYIILQDSSGRMSEFAKQISSKYGMYFRQQKGGKGKIFRDRYKSTLIGGDEYLKMAALYVLSAPLREKISKNPLSYQWSSVREYFNINESEYVDNQQLEYLFRSKGNLNRLLREWKDRELFPVSTEMGYILGDKKFINRARMLFRGEKEGNSIINENQREIFENPEKIIAEFEKEKSINLENIKTDTLKGKRLRGELLVRLKDRAGLKYREIIKYDLFKSLKLSSLGQIYKRAKDRS